jgi:hypothetical protein
MSTVPAPIIRTADGRVTYQCTGEDMITLARSVRGEGVRDADDLLWCYAQRLCLLHNRGQRKTLAAIVKAHSQPINLDVWGPTGTRCRPGGDYHGRPECSPERTAARVRMANTPWESLPVAVRAAVEKWGRAQTPNGVPRATDFAAADLVDRKIAGSNPAGFVMVKRGEPGVRNSFVTETGSRAWSPDYVTVAYEGRVASTQGLPLAVKIVLGIAGAIVVVGAVALAAEGGLS